MAGIRNLRTSPRTTPVRENILRKYPLQAFDCPGDGLRRGECCYSIEMEHGAKEGSEHSLEASYPRPIRLWVLIACL